MASQVKQNKTLPVKVPNALRVTTPRPSLHQKTHIEIINTIRVHLEYDMIVVVSDLTNRHQLHNEVGNIQNSGNMKIKCRNSVMGRDR